MWCEWWQLMECQQNMQRLNTASATELSTTARYTMWVSRVLEKKWKLVFSDDGFVSFTWLGRFSGYNRKPLCLWRLLPLLFREGKSRSFITRGNEWQTGYDCTTVPSLTDVERIKLIKQGTVNWLVDCRPTRNQPSPMNLSGSSEASSHCACDKKQLTRLSFYC